MQVTSAQAIRGGKFMVGFDGKQPIEIDDTPVAFAKDGSEIFSPEQIAFSQYQMSGGAVASYRPSDEEWQTALKAKITNDAENRLLALAGNPTATEIASWPEKTKIVQSVENGGELTPDDIIAIGSDVKKFGGVPQAIGAIKLRATLYKLAATARNELVNDFKVAVEAAPYEAEAAIWDEYDSRATALIAQFERIRAAAIQGDMTYLQGAYAEILARGAS